MMHVTRILFLFVSLLGIGMILITLRNERMQTGYLLGRRQAEEAMLKRQCMDYQLEMAGLLNPVRLQEARRRLGLELSHPSIDDCTPAQDTIIDELIMED